MKGYLKILKHSIKWFFYGLKNEFDDYRNYMFFKKTIKSLKKMCKTNKEANDLLDKMLKENELMYEKKQELNVILKGGIGTDENRDHAKKLIDDICAINKKIGDYHQLCVTELAKEK